MARDFSQYELPEEHLAIMKTIAKLPADKELPDTLKSRYLILRQMADRISLELSPRDLIMAVITSGMFKEPDAPPEKTVIDLFKEGVIARDDTVLGKWRGEWMPCHFLNVDHRNRVKVAFVHDGEERLLPVDAVRQEAQAT
jgi:hypothetical protein